MRVDLRVCCCCDEEEMEAEVIDDSVFIKPGIVEDLLFFLFGSSSTRTSLLGVAFATTSKDATDTAGNIPSYRISKSISGATCDFSSIISTLGWVVVVLMSLFFFSDDGSVTDGARITIAVATGNCGASNNLDTTPNDACDGRRPREGEKAASPPISAVDNTAKYVTARTMQRRRRRCLIELSPPFASLIVLINLTGVRLLPPAIDDHLCRPRVRGVAPPLFAQHPHC